VRAIHVADGDRVEKGQVLIELDPTISTADKTRYTDQLAQARLDQARLKALLAPGAADAFAGVSAPGDLLAAARARLEAEAHEQTAKLAKIDHQTAQKRAEEAQVEAEIAKYDAALPLVQGRAESSSPTVTLSNKTPRCCGFRCCSWPRLKATRSTKWSPT
jgi:hemolysin D